MPLFSKISPIDILIWSTFTESELTAKWLFQFDVALLSLKLSHKALYMECDSLDACLPILTLIQIKLFLLFSHCFAKRCQKILKKYFRSKIYRKQNLVIQFKKPDSQDPDLILKNFLKPSKKPGANFHLSNITGVFLLAMAISCQNFVIFCCSRF